MTEYVVLLRTTGPDGEPWERVISPVFQSEAAADAWRSANGLTTSQTVLTTCLQDVPGEEERRYIVRDLLPRKQMEWEAGEPLALIEALNWCVVTKTPLPDWCASIVSQAAHRLFDFEVRTLDEAFGIAGKIHKGVKLDRVRHQLKYEGLIWVTMNRFREAGKTYEQALTLTLDAMKTRGFEGSESLVKQIYTKAREWRGIKVLDTIDNLKDAGVAHEQALKIVLDAVELEGFRGDAGDVERMYEKEKGSHDHQPHTAPQPSKPRRVVILGDPRRIRD